MEARPLHAGDVDAWLVGFLPAALDREGVPGAPPLVDATCCRVVQEALSSCRQHAPDAPEEVVVEHGDSVVVIVQDAATATGTPTDGTDLRS